MRTTAAKYAFTNENGCGETVLPTMRTTAANCTSTNENYCSTSPKENHCSSLTSISTNENNGNSMTRTFTYESHCCRLTGTTAAEALDVCPMKPKSPPPQVVLYKMVYLVNHVHLKKLLHICRHESLQEGRPVGDDVPQLVQRRGNSLLFPGQARLQLLLPASLEVPAPVRPLVPSPVRLQVPGLARLLEPGEGLAEVAVADSGPVVQPEAGIYLLPRGRGEQRGQLRDGIF
jgi:hypothetical protein